MFTGIIETTGTVLKNEKHEKGNRLIIATCYAQLIAGESIAVNGVCLTLLPLENESEMAFDLSPETLMCTTLEKVQVGQQVNLERAMLASARFGGHYVSGHVDATTHVASLSALGEFTLLELGPFSASAMLYLIPKGSITVDGVSLTINEVGEQRVKLMLIPHTLTQTNLHALRIGQQVNIEYDYLTRIVAHQLEIIGKLGTVE